MPVRVAGRALLLGAGLWLAGCAAPPAPPPAEAAGPVVVPIAPDPRTTRLAGRYDSIEASLNARGLLRQDGGSTEALTPFLLTRNFVRIALFNEYRDDGSLVRARNEASTLRRWEEPIALSVRAGPSVPSDRALQYRAESVAFARRLQGLTGVPVRQVDAGEANFHVLFLSEPERRGFGPELRRLIPGISPATVRAVTDLPEDQYCLVVGVFDASGTRYRTALVVIRAEHPDLMRLACIHEEMAQGMGLANDSPRARPSIFNDNEEFALLTVQDELLLRILYDDRLSPGMEAAEAAPIARQIAEGLLRGPA